MRFAIFPSVSRAWLWPQWLLRNELPSFNSIYDPINKKKPMIYTKEEFNHYPKPCIKASSFDGAFNELSTKERVKQYVALGKLLQLRDYWVDDWKKDSDDTVAVIYNLDGEIKNVSVPNKRSLSYPFTFPTKEMAQKFIECFEDLIKEAGPLV